MRNFCMALSKTQVEYIIPMAIERGVVGVLTDCEIRAGKIFLTFATKDRKVKVMPVIDEDIFEVDFT